MAFAADASYYNVYLEAQGGTCDVMQLYAYKYGSNYRLTSTPTPTMEGYKFDGWYDDVVGGTKITTRYNFKDDTTIYAHWTPTAKKNTATATAAKTTTARCWWSQRWSLSWLPWSPHRVPDEFAFLLSLLKKGKLL